jgi:DsbC/DsbD-like thiol-disulfide interchange protein
MKGKRMKHVILALAAVAIGIPASAGETKNPSGTVSVRAAAKQPANGKQVIEFTMTISPGWHVFANPPGNEKYEPVTTRVLFVGANKPNVVGTDFPAGKPMTDSDGVKFLGYDGQVQFRATVERSGDKALDVEVRFMACDDLNCIPSTIKLTVP